MCKVEGTALAIHYLKRENMIGYIILSLLILISVIGVYFSFKSCDERTPETNCDDEPIDYLIK